MLIAIAQAALLATLSSAGYHHDGQASPYSIGANNAKPGEVPYAAILHAPLAETKLSYCAGSIYSENIIITTARCAERLRTGDTVYAGTLWLDPSTSPTLDDWRQRRLVADFQKHPLYEGPTGNGRYDVALVLVNHPLKLNSHVQTVELAEEDYPEGTICRVAGWGTNDSLNNEPVNALHTFGLTLPSDGVCKRQAKIAKYAYGEAKPQFLAREQTCERRDIVGPRTCAAEYGAPLVCSGAAGKQKLYGVLSFSDKMCNAIAIYTKLSSERNKRWINNCAESLVKGDECVLQPIADDSEECEMQPIQ